MKVKVHVTLKNGVLDPQGKAIANALGNLGYDGVGDVRQGKLIELELSGNVGTGDYELAYRPQPLPKPDLLVVAATDIDGDPIFDVSERVERRTQFSRGGPEAWNRVAAAR